MDQKSDSTRKRTRVKKSREILASGLPGRSRGRAAGTDNTSRAIWIEGNSRDWGEDTLKDRISTMESNIEREIRELRDQVNSFSQKERRGGKKYWYRWSNGSWKYVGPVKPGEDPRAGLEAQIAKLEANREHRKAQARSCVVKELGSHLLIDIALFRAHVDKKLPDNTIKLEDVIG